MSTTNLAEQSKRAFDFIQKLYFEVSYLIKEAEGLLAEEKEAFIFGRTYGYAVTARSSNGLEPSLVNLWMYKKLAVFFGPESSTKKNKGQTETPINKDTRVLYLRFILDNNELPEPLVYYGVLKDFVVKTKTKFAFSKVEQLMTHIEYNENKVFSDRNRIQYEDTYISFSGILDSVPLFEIHNSQEVKDKLLAPALKIFREA